MSVHRYGCAADPGDELILYTGDPVCSIGGYQDHEFTNIALWPSQARDLGEQLIKWANRQEVNG